MDTPKCVDCQRRMGKGSLADLEAQRYADQQTITLANVIDAYERKLESYRSQMQWQNARSISLYKLFDKVGRWLNQKPHLRNDGVLKEVWDEYTRPKF